MLILGRNRDKSEGVLNKMADPILPGLALPISSMHAGYMIVLQIITFAIKPFKALPCSS